MKRLNRLVAIALFTISCGEEPTTPTFEGVYSTLFTLDESSCNIPLPERVSEDVVISVLTEDERELQADLVNQNFSLKLVQEHGDFFGVGNLQLGNQNTILLAGGVITYETIDGELVIFAVRDGPLVINIRDKTEDEIRERIADLICSATYQFAGHKDE